VFSYFLDVLEVVTAVLVRKAIGPLTGAMPAARCQEVVDEFTARPDPCVLVSQIDAGGVGLNIQAASVVIITEPQWKPSTESQAIARAHRMGQVDTVLVHRLLAKNTADDRIRELLEYKTALFDAYARPSDAKEADARAVDGSMTSAVGPTQPPVSMVKQIVAVERRRLGYE
jgi:SNF2 family DNA or RNA helicase